MKVRRRLYLFALCCLLLCARGAQADDPFDIPASRPSREINAAYFGTHFHRLLPVPGEKAFTDWPAVTIGSVRLWDAALSWANLEPQPGQFNFRRMDIYVAAAEAHKATSLYVFGVTPVWASARPTEPAPYGAGSAAEPANMADWDRYVTAVVKRYKGRIAYYELWNEPNFADIPGDIVGLGDLFYAGGVAKMVEMAQHARAIIDREDPKARLLTPGVTGQSKRLDLFLSSGGGAYVSGVAFHYYAPNDREFLLQQRRVQAILARQGLSKLPIFNTEAGFPSTGAQAPAGAALLARTMILGAYVGLETYYQYAWDNGKLGMSGTAGGAPESRHGEAYAAVERWLIGTQLGGCRHMRDDVVVCEGTRGDERLWMAWRPDASGSVLWPLPAGAQVVAIERAVVDAGLRAQDDAAHVAVSGNPVAIWFKASPP